MKCNCIQFRIDKLTKPCKGKMQLTILYHTHGKKMTLNFPSLHVCMSLILGSHQMLIS